MRRLCEEYPLEPHLRKKNALKYFGYRDVLLVGDNCQLPPASGHAPLVTHREYQTLFEFFVLRENRRQEKNSELGRTLDKIKLGGGVHWPEINAASGEGDVHDDVREFFVQAFVRGWNICGANVDPDVGVAMTSYRRDKDRWCEQVVEALEKSFLG